MGNSGSHSTNCYRTTSGGHASRGEIVEAGAAQARLEDHDSPSPIADSIATLVSGNVNWDATPDRIVGPCDEHNK